jgi:hypothetical protein
MDINGAKALKERLGEKAAEEAAPPARADVHDGAPPIYHWTGIRLPEQAPDHDDASAGRGVSRFFRLGLS